jgi:hypothetical protein
MAIELNCRLIRATCVPVVIRSQQVMSMSSLCFPILTKSLDYESTELRPKNLALFVSYD